MNLSTLPAAEAVLIIDYLKDNIPIQQRTIDLQTDSLSNEFVPIKLQLGDEHTLLFKVQLPQLATLMEEKATKSIPTIQLSRELVKVDDPEKNPAIKMTSSNNLLDHSLSILLLLYGLFYLLKQGKFYWQARHHIFQKTAVPTRVNTDESVETDKEPLLSTQPEFSMDEINWLVNLQQTVEQNMSNIHFDVEQLASDLAISTRHLNRRIRQYTGFSTNKYIQETRLTNAKKLLDAQAYKSVKAVAYEVGYKDVKYFGQLYKKRFGRLPSTYFKKQQRQWQGSSSTIFLSLAESAIRAILPKCLICKLLYVVDSDAATWVSAYLILGKYQIRGLFQGR